MKVGNIMAEKNSLMGLAQAITPSASTTNNGFDRYMQQNMAPKNDVTSKPVAKVKDGVIVSEPVKANVSESSETASDMTVTGAAGTDSKNAEGGMSKEQLDAVNQQIRDAVKEAMNLDEETVEAVLTELGIVPLDLLQMENLQQFVLAADGGQEVTDLLLNEQMLADFELLSEVLQGLDLSEITDTPMDQLMQQMQIVMEPLSEMAEELSAVMPELMSAEDSDAAFTDSMSAQADSEAAQAEQFVPVADENSKTILPKEIANEAAMQTTEEQPEVMVSVSETDTENQGSANGQNAEELWNEESQLRPSEAQEEPAEVPVLINHFSQAMHAVNETSAPQQATPQMVQIVEQIVEQIRMNVQSDTTSMEMQLNPESLGKVLLSVTAKAGVMTATFTVQTEEAKAAIESQMYTLRENLEQKELKVDAVEVTVSNFDFTHAGNSGEDQKNMDQGDGKSRRFRMEEQDEEETDELTAEQEAERVRRSVMRDNGSSIDFTA